MSYSFPLNKIQGNILNCFYPIIRLFIGTSNTPTHTGSSTSIKLSKKILKETKKRLFHPIFKEFVIMQHANNTPQNTLDTSARMNGKKMEWKCQTTKLSRSGKPLITPPVMT